MHSHESGQALCAVAEYFSVCIANELSLAGLFVQVADAARAGYFVSCLCGLSLCCWAILRFVCDVAVEILRSR